MTADRQRHILVVGSGIAGLYSALRLRAARPETVVTLICKGRLEDSNTWHAQGGIAAVLPVTGSEAAAGETQDPVSGRDTAAGRDTLVGRDTVFDHIADTLAAGDGACLPEAVEVLCSEAGEHLLSLLDLGTPFDRTATGALAVGREAAHSAPRILHAGGDATGAAVARTLIAAVLEDQGITVLENAFLTDLMTGGGTTPVATGVKVLHAGEVSAHPADAVVLATGGAGQLFTHNTNPPGATGDGLAAAWRAGAVVKDLEFFQFHPTALDVPGNLLISEAVRGEGAVLRDGSGARFMPEYHPAAELAPRDVVSRSIALHLRRRGEDRVFLDATALGGEAFLATRFPSLHRQTAAHGFDWTAEPLPVVPAAHYWMGGIQTDRWGRTSLRGLYAVGEVACTGVHGANRLASNSLLEGLVFAGRAAHAAAGTAGGDVWPTFPSTSVVDPVWRRPGSPNADPCDREALQLLMADQAGVTRTGAGLALCAKQLDQWATPGETLQERETGNLLTVARLLVRSAEAREESRGAHYRTDFPGRSPDTGSQPLNAYRRATP